MPLTLRIGARCALLLLVLFGLAACDTSAPQAARSDIGFTHLPPIRLAVAELTVEERYRPPLAPPNVEHELPVSPSTVMRAWARDRLRTAAQSGSAKFIIIDAAVTREALRKAGGIHGLVTTDQAERVSLSMNARLEVSTAGGLGTGFASAQVKRSRTLPEGMSLNERDDALYQFMVKAAQDFNAEMEKNVTAHLAPFLRQ